jgi:hypothetical protein
MFCKIHLFVTAVLIFTSFVGLSAAYVQSTGPVIGNWTLSSANSSFSLSPTPKAVKSKNEATGQNLNDSDVARMDDLLGISHPTVVTHL